MGTAISVTGEALVGFYGGTFDPVHRGHTHAALAVGQALGLEQVHLILAARPGHRNAPRGSVDHRWCMLQLACEEHTALIADDRELHRSGPSYTITTLEQARAEAPHQVPCWILGQDSFATLPIWHRWQDLLEYCNLIVIDRPGDTRPEPAEVARLCTEHEVCTLSARSVGQIKRLALPMLEISASDVRRRLAAGEPCEHLLAPPVYTYINHHGLYTTTEDPV